MKKLLFIILIIAVLGVAVLYYINKGDVNDTEEVSNSLVENTSVINNNLDLENIEINEDKEEISNFEWEKDIPENHNIDSSIIENFNNSISQTQITSSIIVKDGVIVNEYFKDGYDKNSTFGVHSCSKSITSSLVGIAIDKGYIESVDVSLSNYFPEILDKDSQYMKEITIKDLLTNTSGMTTTEDTWYDWRASSNWIEYIFNNPMVSKPGTRFSYSTGNTHLLSAIMQKATGMTLYEFGKENLFDSIGMKSIECGTDAQGISDGGNGYTLNAYDMAKFGELYLNNGVWQGKQIVPKNWVKESTKVQFERNSGTADYGYQWWVRKFGRQGYDAYFAQGHGCQFIFVIPEIKLVITFTSSYQDNSESSIYWQYVSNIVNACN